MIPREDFEIYNRRILINMSIKKLNQLQLSYLAGFLDGDGAVFAQIVRGDAYKHKFDVRVTVGFYQHISKKWFLERLRTSLGNIGYIRQRGNMLEYIITASQAVFLVLDSLLPYLVLKNKSAGLILKIIDKKRRVVNFNDFIEVCKIVDEVSYLTYGKKKTISSQTVEDYFSFKSP